MTLAELINKLVLAAAQNPKLLNNDITIEHRNCEDDNPESVGIYPYPHKVGLSFWRD